MKHKNKIYLRLIYLRELIQTVRMHFKQHEENRAKYVTSEAKIGQTFVWPFLIQVMVNGMAQMI